MWVAPGVRDMRCKHLLLTALASRAVLSAPQPCHYPMNKLHKCLFLQVERILKITMRTRMEKFHEKAEKGPVVKVEEMFYHYTRMISIVDTFTTHHGLEEGSIFPLEKNKTEGTALLDDLGLRATSASHDVKHVALRAPCKEDAFNTKKGPQVLRYSRKLSRH